MAEPAIIVQAMSIGLDPICKAVAENALGSAKLVEVPYDLEKLMEPANPAPSIVLCGPPPEGVNLIEVAQMLRMNYQEQGIFYITTVRKGFERKDFQKNGFSDAFLIPVEADVFKSTVEIEISKASKGQIKTYRSVQMVDITPDAVLDFDTYLYMPANKKHIKMSAAGDSLDKTRAEKLAKNNVNSIKVTQDQISHFYKFTAKRLKELGDSTGLSATEKRDRMQGAIRSLMAGMFNDSDATATTDQGRAMAKDCQEIVKAYVVQSDAKANWYEKLVGVTGEQSGVYSHTANVATYAALFSMGLGIGKPEELAMAGLLHDIGLADVPPAIQLKSESERTKEEQESFKKHPELSLSIIMNRKLIVPEIVKKIVIQHQERFDGTGYPRGLAGDRICKEAQVLALADEFDYLTAISEGKPKMKPHEAVETIRKSVMENPTNAKFDPELVSRLCALFPKN